MHPHPSVSLRCASYSEPVLQFLSFWMTLVFVVTFICAASVNCAVGSVIANVVHGRFENVSVPSGISVVIFTNIPPRSVFIVVQLHSPFNPLLASTMPSFDYGASQISEHCGLVSTLASPITNVSLYIYSGYERDVLGWVKADAYGSNYPIPGGCGQYWPSGFASNSLSSAILELPSELRIKNDSTGFLRYWTSLLRFDAAAPPGTVMSDNPCSHLQNSSDGLTYHLYSAPLVTAGGSYNTFVQPTSGDVASIVQFMSRPDTSFGSLVSSFTLTSNILGKNKMVELPIARRPGTAMVLNIVVEYRGADEQIRMAYTPFVLYGCPIEDPRRRTLASAFIVHNHSSQLSCGVLPPNSPNVYFPVAVLLLASLFYGCSCNFLIWPRCAASVMVMGSLFGTLLFFRYSLPTSDAVLLLIISVLLPGLLSLVCFLVLWCVCIRPTLRYQQLYGRGPLLKVHESDGVSAPTAVSEPWNDDWTGGTQTDSSSNLPLLALNDVRMSDLNVPSRIQEQSNYSSVHPSYLQAVNETDADGLVVYPTDLGCCGFTPWTSLRFGPRSHSSADPRRSTKVLSLKPRRLARLPPALPAVFLIVSCLSTAIDQMPAFRESSTSYLSFVIFMWVLTLCPMFFFKNLAFGLSTALVGVYLSLACVCLFLVRNALLPHLLIEQFLRLTWLQHRLTVLRIESFGLYDVLIFVAWFGGTLIFGLLTLCLVRLQDARELSEAQRGRLANTSLWSDPDMIYLTGRNSSVCIEPNAGRGALGPSVRSSQFPVVTSNENLLSVPFSGTMTHNNDEASEIYVSPQLERVPVTSRGSSERTQLLSSTTLASYGGLASTNRRSLMPLSRVQLAAKTGVVRTQRS